MIVNVVEDGGSHCSWERSVIYNFLLLRRGSNTCLIFFLSAVDLAIIMRMV